MSPALIGSSFLTFSQYPPTHLNSSRLTDKHTHPPGIGSFIGIILCNATIDRIYARLQHRASSDGTPQPEHRLPLVVLGTVCLPLTVTLYGWAAGAHWPVAAFLLSVVLMGFSLILTIVPLTAYVVDAFGLYAASAMTAVLISRCLMGTFLPLATAPLTGKLGYGWGFTVLAALCVVMAPIPVVVMRYGRRWRQVSEYTRDTREVK